jgi:hypothetical protein
VVDAFSCGVAVLDQCLKRRALINQQGGASRAFVTADDARRVRREWIW